MIYWFTRSGLPYEDLKWFSVLIPTFNICNTYRKLNLVHKFRRARKLNNCCNNKTSLLSISDEIVLPVCMHRSWSISDVVPSHNFIVVQSNGLKTRRDRCIETIECYWLLVIFTMRWRWFAWMHQLYSMYVVDDVYPNARVTRGIFWISACDKNTDTCIEWYNMTILCEWIAAL